MIKTTAFVSYSWDDDQHKEWVSDLAKKLRDDGVESILDQWYTVPGDQLPDFMEREIRGNDFVLIVCTPNYRLKSDGRQGGVGYEGDIMTAEVHTKHNHRKFIPILARGAWEDSAPSWLLGKYYIDLSAADRYQENYMDLITTLRGERTTAPPVHRPSQTRPKSMNKLGPNDPIKIVGIIVDEVTEPSMDGTPGSVLYTVPFQLNRTPSSIWSAVFEHTWNSPPRFTSMHIPGNAKVIGSKIILDRTTIDDVKKYHRDTLVLCINKANKEEEKLLVRRRREKDRRQEQMKIHRSNVKDVADEIEFD